MSFKFGAKIITDNLELYLDAGNRYSYAGSGTSWRDISGKDNHFTLVNSPVFTGTAIRFNIDGANQHATCDNTSFGNFGSSSFTLEYIFNLVPGAGVTTDMFFSSLFAKRSLATSIASSGNPGWTYNPGGSATNGTYAGLWSCMDSNAVPNNTNHRFDDSATENVNFHVIHVVERKNLEVTASLYHNGNFVRSYRHTASGNGLYNNSLAATLMKSGNNQYRSGSLYVIRAYTRNLSAAEVRNNHMASKARFNL